MKNYTDLIKNVLVFGLGNVGSKLIIFLMLPLLTAWLPTEEYGEMDIIVTTIAIIIPLITLNIVEAVIRFGLDKKNYSLTYVVTNSFLFIIIGFVVLLCFYPLFNFIPIIENYINYFYIIIVIQSIHISVKQFCRTIDKLITFIVSDIFYSILLLIFSILFIYYFDFGIKGYFIGMILAYFFDLVFLSIKTRFFQYLNLSSVNSNLMKDMAIYCAPLVPNSIMWWAMNVSDRYIITILLGTAANGIYAVASKIPSLLTVLYAIFYKAWQISSIETSNVKGRDHYYSNVFNIFFYFMSILVSFIILFNDTLINYLVSEEYSSVSLYVPILLFGALFSCLSGFMGSFYIVSKKTKGAFSTSIIGGILNILLNVLLIPLIGLYGAALSTLMAFFLTWLLRVKDTRKFFNIKFSSWKIFINILLITIQIFIIYLPITDSIRIIINIVILLLLIINSYKYIRNLMKPFINKFIQ